MEKLPDGIPELAHHPVFQLAPLGDVRPAMLKQERRILKAVYLKEDGIADALIWTARYWHRDETYKLAVTDDALFDPYFHAVRAAENRFTPYTHWIGMTRDRVWRSGGGERDHEILAQYLHLVDRLDRHGTPLPPEPQGPIPDEDEEALSRLAL
ncbi:hypothetical protein ASF52_05610 [Methylobacterium sp. Leaf112]|nr:hypothetical protein ASF52_05610 [Methylobacterium sp. Leaf112]